MSNATMTPSATSTANGNPYAPQEPANIFFFEKASLVGNILSEISYGISIIVFFRTLYTLIHPQYRRGQSPNYTYIVYISILFSVSTMFLALNTHLLQSAYIDNRNFSGGPAAYELAQYSKPLNIFANACFIISNWLADALLMYRCFVIYRYDKWILVFPMLLYLASISMGIITLFKSSRPNSNLWSSVTVNFGLPYFTISVANNVLLTILISSRLLFHRRQIHQTIGSVGTSNIPYVSIVTMLVESSALYAVLSILFIGPYAANNYASDIFLPVLSQAQVIAPMLIIMRVAQRRAWTSNTATGLQQNSNIDFRPNLQLSAVATTTNDIQSSNLDLPVSVATDKEFSESGGVEEKAESRV